MTRRLLQVAGVVAALVGLAWLWRATAMAMTEEDGVGLVTALALEHGGLAGWHHAAYMPLGWVAEHIVGVGYTLSALLWLSAVTAALTVGVLGAVLWQVRARPAAWVAVAAFAASPGMWVNATRVEVHTVQMLGAALLAWWCCAARNRSNLWLGLGMFAMAVVAATTHNSNVLLLPGAAWIAARAGLGTGDLAVDRRRLVLAGVAAAAGGYLGLFLDHLSLPGGSGSALGDIRDLWLDFASLSSWRFVRTELLLSWFPVLAAALGLIGVAGRGGLRAALPFLAAAAPPVAIFLVSGISTRGGYFSAAMVFVVAAAATATRSAPGARVMPCRIVVAAMLPVLFLGVAQGYSETQDERRIKRADMTVLRLQQAKNILPDGGCIIVLDPLMQSVNGREPPWKEINLFMRLFAVMDANADPSVLVDAIEEDLAPFIQRGDPLAFGCTWRYMLDTRPRLAEYMQPLEDMLHRHYALREVLSDGQIYLVGRPRD